MSNGNLKYDLPELANDGDSEILLDANYGFYEAQKEGDAFVYVEKYAVNKLFYTEQAKGTVSTNRNDAYLVKQTNYSDIGGGMVTFERHYAILPTTWFDKDIVTIRVYFTQSPTVKTFFINNPSGAGVALPVLAKVSRAYYLEENIPTLTIQEPDYSYTAAVGADFDASNITDQKIAPDELGLYMGNIYEVVSYFGA